MVGDSSNFLAGNFLGVAISERLAAAIGDFLALLVSWPAMPEAFRPVNV